MYETVTAESLPKYVFGLTADRHRATGRNKALDFLRLCAKDINPNALIAFAARKKQLAKWGEDFAETVAAEGFALEATDPVLLVCVSCGAKVTIERPDQFENDFRAVHNLGCQLSRVRALCSSPLPGSNRPSRPSLQTRRLKAHLRAELASSKATVAREFRFDDDVICMTLARQFLKTGRAFENAGALIDELTELTLITEREESLPMIEGLAELVNQLTPPPTGSIATPPGMSPTRRNSPQTDSGVSSSSSEEKVDLRLETQMLLLSSKCKVCRNEELSYVALPCSHFVFCNGCQTTKKCPICGMDVSAVIRTYKS